MTDIVKKPKKTMTPQRLEQLALARKKALEIRQAGAVIKMEAKIANITQTSEIDETELPKKEIKKAPNFHPTPTHEIENKIIKAELVENPIVEELLPDFSPRVDVKPPVLSRQPTLDEDDDDEEVRAPALKPTAPKNKNNAERGRSRPIKTKIVIEQSSDDEDEFHPHEHVIFVKRKSKNDSKAKVVPVQIPAATPAPPTSPVRGQRENIVLQHLQEQRQMPAFPLPNTMSDFVNAGFTNYRKYY